MKNNWLIISILALIIVVMFQDMRDSEQRLNDFKSQISKFEIGEQKYLQIIDEQGNKIAEQEQVVISQKDAIELGLLEIERLKKINSQVVVTTTTAIDTFFMPFKDSNSTFGINTQWYSLSGSVIDKGVSVDSLRVLNKMSVTIGLKSNGWFKAATPSVVLTNENPYTHTSAMSNIVVVEKKKWYQKNNFIYGSGILSGLIISNLIK